MMAVPFRETGTISHALRYVLGPYDEKGRLRQSVELLHGDPDRLSRLVRTLPFKNGYDSLVVAYAPGEKHSIKEVRKFLRELMAVMFPGMTGRIEWLAVLHRETNGMHLHILSACVDLVTGKQFSTRGIGTGPAKILCCIRNLRNGWADPADPERAQLVFQSQEVVIQHAVAGEGLPQGTGVRAYARQLAIDAVLDGGITTQDDMENVLRQIGTPVRKDAHSITVDVPGIASRGRAGNKVKFSGPLYSRKLDRQKILYLHSLQLVPPALRKRITSIEDDLQAADELETQLKIKTAKRAAEVAERYALTPQRALKSLSSRVAMEVSKREEAKVDAGRLIDEATRSTQVRSIQKGQGHDSTIKTSTRHTGDERTDPVHPSGGNGIGKNRTGATFEWLRAGIIDLVHRTVERLLDAIFKQLRGHQAEAIRIGDIESAGSDASAAVGTSVDADFGKNRMSVLDRSRAENALKAQAAMEKLDVDSQRRKRFKSGIE